MAISGCNFESRVNIALIWKETEIPDSFSSDIPNYPDELSDILNGHYCLTLPGTYSLQYNYISGESYSLSFTLEDESAVLGRENMYYDVYILKYEEPYIVRYPY